MKNLFSIAMLLFMLSVTKGQAQSRFSHIDQAGSSQLTFLDGRRNFAVNRLAAFQKEANVISTEQRSPQVVTNLPITLYDIDLKSFSKEKALGLTVSEKYITLAAIKNVSTTKSDFLGYPIKGFTVRQADFEELGYFDGSVLNYHF